MPLQATSGAASQDAYGGNGVPVVPTYIEDVFSTYLFTGTETTRSITNDIDLSTKGGLVWIKGRNAGYDNNIIDTATGSGLRLRTNSTVGQAAAATGVTSFNTNGFSLGTSAEMNGSTVPYASWTFRKQPKFFDVVTFTAGTSSNRRISHSLGSAPGMILLKANESRNWYVYHRSLGRGAGAYLNLTNAAFTSANTWGTSDPTATDFGFDEAGWATSGVTQTAYLFAHDAGGFGLTGTDNVISCGSITINGSGGSGPINLGFEPQWLLIKKTSGAGNWQIVDTMRNWSQTAGVALFPNTAGVESDTWANYLPISSTGFAIADGATGAGETWIYMAIRRGPMKVPTTGTSVYNAIVRNGTGANATVTGVGFPVDLDYTSYRPASHNPVLSDRLRGAQRTLSSRGTYAEQTETTALTSFASMDGVSYGANTSDFFNGFNSATGSYVNWFFRRSPSVFDIVCYTGTGSAMTVSHNLAAVPELMIVKRRNSVTYGEWFVYTATLGNAKYQLLDTTQASTTANSGIWNLTTPTSTIMSVGSDLSFSASPYVAYLFATCAGVSKVFSYTGNGSSQTINCGFTAGARFVLIKRTDSTGDWYVWDTARGIVAGNDPHLSLNTTATEVTTDDTIDTDNTGFVVNQLSATDVNVSSATYIGLAIA